MIDKIGKINYTEKRDKRDDRAGKVREILSSKQRNAYRAIRIYLRRQRKRDGNRG